VTWAAAAPWSEGNDPFGPNRVPAAQGLLADFNQAGVLAAADVHVAERLGRLGGDGDALVALAAALAVRAPRYGHVCVDLGTVQESVVATDEGADWSALPWPDPAPWLAAVEASSLVAVGPGGPADRPLRVVGSTVYLDRYWRDEQAIAADLGRRAARPDMAVDDAALAEALPRLFPQHSDADQRWAAAAAVIRPLSVVAGGPGTGKTTTVARLIVLLHELAVAAGSPPPLIGLAAPTGKAAARMEEAVRSATARLDGHELVAEAVGSVTASTLHRLLGKRPDSESRFRHDRHHQLPHDVLIVDETSMVSLSMMARLCEAVRSDARLVLVGDPQQLASVEAGAVLGDIVGPARDRLRMGADTAARLAQVTGVDLPDVQVTPGQRGVGNGIVVLRANHRFEGALAVLAAAIKAGDEDGALTVLTAGTPEINWLRPLGEGEADAGAGAGAAMAPSSPSSEDPAHPGPVPARPVGLDGDIDLSPLRHAVVERATALVAAALAGDAVTALDQLDQMRVLCAHRSGPAGVGVWTQRIEGWLAETVEGFSATRAWYPGRPVMVTANDYGLRLFNGDTGVVVAGGAGSGPAAVAAAPAGDGGVVVVFRGGQGITWVSPARLTATETVFATTVHKAQGSEFGQVAIVLPPPESAVLSRELLYTAVTRARQRLILAGSEASIRAAIGRPIARASGLTRLLWS
jgi:exodeoxyribonuclease V alpha subunit